jgi:signal transduction histidine kinase
MDKNFTQTPVTNESDRLGSDKMEHNSELKLHAAQDLAQRSRAGTVYYLIIFIIIAVMTPYITEHPWFMTSMGAVIVLGTVIRAACVWLCDRHYQIALLYWNVVFTAGILSQALGWSMISMMSLYFYGWDWTTMVACLSAAAFSAAAITSFSIYFWATLAYLTIMFVPTLIMTVIINTQHSLTATFLFATFFVFLIRNAKRLNIEYWTALRNTHLLDERANELEAKNAELESFAYSVSHDLRSPLRSLDGFSKLLEEDARDKLNDVEKDYLQRISKAAQRMGQLIDDLLQLSRINRANFTPQQVNLSDMVKTSLEKLREKEPTRNIEIDIEPDVQVRGDASLLDIALQNLVNNSWKYTSKNPYTKIRFGTMLSNGERAYYIKDNGVGFDTRYSEKLFGPFQRLHGVDEFPGTGIGLATVKRIVDRHGGDVWANSKVDKGSTFYFTLGRSVLNSTHNSVKQLSV